MIGKLDHARALRPKARHALSPFGRVVFGLSEEEVGHTSPDWTPNTRGEANQKRAACESAAALAGSPDPNEECHLLPIPAKSTDELDMHADMAMAEWWILAQSDWLCSAGSSFSETASGVGLGPYGAMERYTYIDRSNIHDRAVRRDWEHSTCRTVAAVDPKDASTCPNNGV